MVISHKIWMHPVEKPETWQIDCMEIVAQGDDLEKQKAYKTLIYLLYLISAVSNSYVFLFPSE